MRWFLNKLRALGAAGRATKLRKILSRIVAKLSDGAPVESSERTAHYHGRYKAALGEWHLYAVAQNT